MNYLDSGKTISLIMLIVVFVFGCSSSQNDENVNDENVVVMNEQIDFARLNVVVILIDTLRADHLGTYGYDRKTSPNIDRLAAKGVVFERAYAPSSYTRESVASLFTGYYPWHGGHSDWDAHPLPEVETMAEMFSTAGYQTGLFSNSIIISHQDFLRGFDEVAFPNKTWAPSGKGHELSTTALEYANTVEDDRPFFMYVHYMDPHGPYKPPFSLLKKFKRVQVKGPLHLYRQLRSDLPRLKLKGFGPDDPRFTNLIDRYDAEIAHTDEALQALMDGLEDLNKVENTLFIITSDHGEEFMEHDSVAHGWTLYNEVIHVPLIFYAPGILKPARHTTPVSLVDVLPTLEAITQAISKNEAQDGVPLLQQQNGRVVSNLVNRPIISELGISRQNVLRTVIHNDMKYISSVRWINWEEKMRVMRNHKEIEQGFQTGEVERPDPWGTPVLREVYDLNDDPLEQKNLLRLSKYTTKVPEDLLEALSAYHQNGTISSERESPTLPDADELEALKALGYIE